MLVTKISLMLHTHSEPTTWMTTLT